MSETQFFRCEHGIAPFACTCGRSVVAKCTDEWHVATGTSATTCVCGKAMKAAGGAARGSSEALDAPPTPDRARALTALPEILETIRQFGDVRCAQGIHRHDPEEGEAEREQRAQREGELWTRMVDLITAALARGAADGAGLIAAERRRQIEAEGWAPEHDAAHTGGEMIDAAYAYALRAQAALYSEHNITFRDVREGVPSCWPWEREWWKPSTDPIRNLAKAGALIAAEIDRLQRRAALDQARAGRVDTTPDGEQSDA